MKTTLLITLLLTAACGSNVQPSDNETPVTTSPVTAQSSNDTVCAWVNAEYSFHTYDPNDATTPPSNLTEGEYWKVQGTADNTSFTLYVTVVKNVPWVSVLIDDNIDQVACPSDMTVGSSTIEMSTLANGYLVVTVNESNGSSRQYIAAGYGE